MLIWYYQDDKNFLWCRRQTLIFTFPQHCPYIEYLPGTNNPILLEFSKERRHEASIVDIG
jgi:hypothetical protein